MLCFALKLFEAISSLLLLKLKCTRLFDVAVRPDEQTGYNKYRGSISSRKSLTKFLLSRCYFLILSDYQFITAAFVHVLFNFYAQPCVLTTFIFYLDILLRINFSTLNSMFQSLLCSATSLRSRSSFVLVLCKQGEIFLWHGSKSSDATRATAIQGAHRLIEK